MKWFLYYGYDNVIIVLQKPVVICSMRVGQFSGLAPQLKSMTMVGQLLFPVLTTPVLWTLPLIAESGLQNQHCLKVLKQKGKIDCTGITVLPNKLSTIDKFYFLFFKCSCMHQKSNLLYGLQVLNGMTIIPLDEE